MADRLNIKEKYTVQKSLNEDKTINEISENIGKSQACINKYIEDELLPLLERIRTSRPVEEDVVDEVFLTEDIKKKGVNLLVAAGIPQSAAEECIRNQIEPSLTGKIEDANVLYKLCINRLAIHTSMIQKTVGGKEGVTISTQAASQIAEEQQKRVIPSRAESPPSHIFKPKG